MAAGGCGARKVFLRMSWGKIEVKWYTHCRSTTLRMALRGRHRRGCSQLPFDQLENRWQF